MIVTVFGASKTNPGEPLYQQALNLGKLLAESGFSVATGGYIGTMEAVSRGAAEAGGHVIGVTCAEIECWRTAGANAWVQEEQKQETLLQRLDALINQCDAALALPGGVGTLAEILVTWNRLIIQSISPRPLILIGPEWERTISAFIDQQGTYISNKDRPWIQYTDTVPQAVELLKTLLK
jgi:uncharacterized protein (TIGR00730 family)